MIARGRTVGVLAADNRNSRAPISAHTLDLLQAFAAHAAVAVDNARLFQEIQEQSRELELASKHKTQFLANMSHELRTPMHAVLGYTDLILDDIFGDVPPPIRETLERVKTNGHHLLGLINDVLDLSKIEAGQLTLSLGDYAMGDVVHGVVSAVQSLAAEKKLALETIVRADLPRGRGDERRLTQVLLNLAGNAIKFTDSGRISIDARASDGAYRRVGVGYRPRDLRSRPAEDLRGVPAGRQLQHPHEGRQRARALDLSADRGAARRAPLGGIGPRRGINLLFHRAGQRGAEGGASMKKRILAIEDHEENRRILGYLLASAGFEMIEAVTGEEGVAAAEKERPDLIVMDIQLPGLDGYEATRRIKANPALRHIPIIVVTSYALSGDDVKAFEAGCDAYVTKPFAPRELLAKIRTYLPVEPDGSA